MRRLTGFSTLLKILEFSKRETNANVVVTPVDVKQSRHGFVDSADIEIDAYGLDDGNLRHHVDSLLNVNRRYDDVSICFTL